MREYWGWRVVQELDEDLERLVPLSVGATAGGPLATTLLPQNHQLGLLSGDGNVPILQRDPHTDHYAHSGERDHPAHSVCPFVSDATLKTEARIRLCVIYSILR